MSKKKQSVGGMVKTSLGMMLSGGIPAGHVAATGAGAAYAAKETTKGMSGKRGKKKRTSSPW